MLGKALVSAVLVVIAFLAVFHFLLPWPLVVSIWLSLTVLVWLAKNSASEDHDEEMLGQSPNVRLCNAIMMQAVKDGATAVDIRPEKTCTKVYFTLPEQGGVEAMIIPQPLHENVIGRFRILADIDVLRTKELLTGVIKIHNNVQEYHLNVSNYFVKTDSKVPNLVTLEGIKFTIKKVDSSD